MNADGNPNLITGSTVNVNSKIANGKYLVESINTSMSADQGYSLDLNASAYYGDTAFEEPALDIEAIYTALQVISIGDPSYMVEFDGSSSFSNMGPITRYLWAFPTLTQDGSDPTVWYTFKDTDISNGNSVTVSLQVFDGMGNTDIYSSGVTLEWLQSQAATKYRHMYGALNTRAVGSTDGGVTWNVSTAPGEAFLSVAASNFAISGGYTASGHALFGTNIGNIYKTTDAALTLQSVYSAGSAINDINIPELDASFAAAGASDGKVYKSSNFGVTWTEIGDFAFPILQVKFNYTNFDEITVLGSGLNNLYITFDSGGSWTNIPTGKAGTWLTDSNVKNYEAYTSGIYNITDSAEVSNTPTNPFPALTYAINVDDNAALYAGIMGVDSTGQHYNYSGGLQATQFNPANKTKHMIRDGEVPFLVYYANASGIGKSLDSNVTMSGLYYPSGVAAPASGWGYKVAYGPLAGPQPQARLLWWGTHFGGMNLPPGYTGDQIFGYLASSGGAGSWSAVPNSSLFGTQVELIAVTAGYVACSRQDTHVSFIDFTTDVPQGFADFTIFSDPGYGGGLTPGCLAIAFGRNPAVSPPKVFGNITSIPNVSVPVFQVFNDFYSGSTSVTSVGGGGLRSALHPVRVSAKGKETLITEEVGSIFSSNSNWYLANAASMTINTRAETVTGLWTPAYRAGLSTDWYVIAKRGGDTHYWLANTDTGSPLVETVIPVAVNLGHIYDSALDSTLVYWADGAGVYSSGSYGADSATTLFTPPVGYTIATFSVTHDKAETKDYLAVVLDPPSGTTCQVRYSLDGGLTWLQAPDLPGTAGFNGGIWYVDTR